MTRNRRACLNGDEWPPADSLIRVRGMNATCVEKDIVDDPWKRGNWGGGIEPFLIKINYEYYIVAIWVAKCRWQFYNYPHIAIQKRVLSVWENSVSMKQKGNNSRGKNMISRDRWSFCTVPLCVMLSLVVGIGGQWIVERLGTCWYGLSENTAPTLVAWSWRWGPYRWKDVEQGCRERGLVVVKESEIQRYWNWMLCKKYCTESGKKSGSGDGNEKHSVAIRQAFNNIKACPILKPWTLRAWIAAGAHTAKPEFHECHRVPLSFWTLFNHRHWWFFRDPLPSFMTSRAESLRGQYDVQKLKNINQNARIGISMSYLNLWSLLYGGDDLRLDTLLIGRGKNWGNPPACWFL